MTKKLLSNIVLASYNKDELDGEKVLDISSYLNRKELKEYIRALKRENRKNTVWVDVPSNGGQYGEEIKSLFPNKRIEYRVDPSLMLGIRVTDNDMVYEMNMRDSLNRMVDYLGEQI